MMKLLSYVKEKIRLGTNAISVEEFHHFCLGGLALSVAP